jgi:Golgi CORVET complex core vacuolar protein 8
VCGGGGLGAAVIRPSNGYQNGSYNNDSNSNETVWTASAYPYLRILLYTDTSAALSVLSLVLDDCDAQFNDSSSNSSSSSSSVGGSVTTADEMLAQEKSTLAAAAVDAGLTVCPSRRCAKCHSHTRLRTLINVSEQELALTRLMGVESACGHAKVRSTRNAHTAVMLKQL